MSLPAYSPSPALNQSDAFEPCPYPPSAAHQGHLPHLVHSVAALSKAGKSRVGVFLAEDTVYLRPDKRGRRLEDWGCEVDKTEDRRGGAQLRGIVAIYSSKARTVDDVVLRLEADGRMAVQGSPPESYALFHRTTSLKQAGGLERVMLRKGINTFEFCMRLPSGAPATVEASVYGRLRYTLSAHVPGSSLLHRGELTARTEVVVVHLPDRIEGPDLSFEDEVSDDLPWSGPKRLQISAEALTIGGTIDFDLSIPSPPADLTIFGARAYIHQIVEMRSVTGVSQTSVGPQRTVASQGYLEGWQTPEFVVEATEKHLNELLLSPERAAEAVKEDGWLLRCSGIIDTSLRPTTIAPPPDALSPGHDFSAELAFEVLFSQASSDDTPGPSPLMVATIYRKRVTLLSAKCAGDALVLPKYSA